MIQGAFSNLTYKINHEENIIILEKVVKSYRNGMVIALNDVNLSIKAGTFTVFGGVSGSGKTTLLNLIGGLDRPTSGNIIVLNHKYDEMSESELTRFRRKNIGFIWQFSNLFPNLTALQNVMMPLEFDPSWNYTRAKKRAKEVLLNLGLTNRLDHRPNQMSGGEQQRVAIARAIVNYPKIILADEPTGNVDADNATKIAKLLKKLNEEQDITVVVVTHDISLFKNYGEIIKIRNGRIIT